MHWRSRHGFLPFSNSYKYTSKILPEQGIFLPEIQLRASVEVKDCCARNFLRQSFQLRKSQNNQRYLDKSFRSYGADAEQNL